MEISDYVTNVLAVNDLSSIQYYYLEYSTGSEQEQSSILEIEAAWRKSKALVIQYKRGIWVFGRSSQVGDVLPPTAAITAEGLVEFHGNVLAIITQGTFDPADVWRVSKSLTTSTGGLTGVTSPPSSADSNFRSNQPLNAKASLNNATIGVKQEDEIETDSVLDDFSVVEPLFTVRDIQEHFISAVLATLSYDLCHNRGFIALNARTLVLPSSNYFEAYQDGFQSSGLLNSSEKVWLITLDVHLTSLGTLLVRAWPNAPFDFTWSLKPMQGPNFPQTLVDGTVLFLAPSGKVGRYRGKSGLVDFGATVDLDATMQNRSFGYPFQEHLMPRWKQRCLTWLASKGLKADALDSGGWIMVQILSPPNFSSPPDAEENNLWDSPENIISIAWPALLCFKRTSFNITDIPTSKSSLRHDPLLFAEDWFGARHIRESAVAKRRRERESDAATLQAQAEVDARILASNFSPAGLRRASLAGAVYPTPPDGIQPTIGATPSFDGNGSTPGQLHPQSQAVEPENIAVSKGELEESESNIWDSGVAKRDQTINSALDFNDTGADNLFGDVAGDLFGENDITDADFSFFDTPDPVETVPESNIVNYENSSEDMKENTADHNTAEDTALINANSGKELDVVMAETSAAENSHDKNGSDPENLHTQSGVKLDVRHDLASSPEHLSTKDSQSPPLNPALVFEKLSHSSFMPRNTKEPNLFDRPIGSYVGVRFDQSLFSFSKNYGAKGRFMYPSMSKPTDQRISKSLPSTGYLKKTGKRKPNIVKLLSQALISPPKLLSLEIDHNEKDNASDIGSSTNSLTGSPISDQDDMSISSGYGPLIFSPGLKRKRRATDTNDADDDEDNDDYDEEMTSPSQDLKVDRTQYLQSVDHSDLLDHILLLADPADWSLSNFLSSPEPLNSTGSLSDNDYIASAQVLADQALSQTLQIPLHTDSFVDNQVDDAVDRHNIKVIVQQKLSHAARSCFERAVICTMNAVVDVQDLQQVGPANRMISRQTPVPRLPHASDVAKLSLIFNLPPPHLEVQRAESKLTVLPPAIPFWENLGLAPCKGSKDVTALCIYPNGEDITESVEAFLEQLRNAYESSRLGSHDRFSHADFVDGHVPMDFSSSTLLSVADHQAILSKIRETSINVGTALATGTTSETNLVIYYVYDPECLELLVPICSAFHDLFEVYKENLENEKLPATNELVFQLIPMNRVSSTSSLVIPPPTEYTRLAMEVFDRCVDLNTGSSVPSIILEQPLPRTIDFKLSPNPSASPLQENSYMHVAYAQSLDDRWITAAWTDNTGTQQMTASYCLGRRNSSLTLPFSSIAREIWETTLGIIAFQKVNWRVLIAKSGVMDPPEIEEWQSLASDSHQLLAAKESNAQITLTLLTVDSNPSLELLPASISVAPNILAAQSSVYTTPVSTPQASIFSPEPGNVNTPQREPGPANAPTPGDSNAELKIDVDATFVDISDQTWGAILSHRLNNSRSLLEFKPTLISGYLIKRSGAATSDVPIVIEVSIVHSEVYPRMLDGLLREILGLYRGLATLARVRGCVDPCKDGRPWHVAAAEKAVNVLYMLM